MFFDYFPTTRYVVVSDSELKALRLDKAEREKTRLESVLNRYNTYVEEIKLEIENINKQVSQLQPAEEQAKLAG